MALWDQRACEQCALLGAGPTRLRLAMVSSRVASWTAERRASWRLTAAIRRPVSNQEQAEEGVGAPLGLATRQILLPHWMIESDRARGDGLRAGDVHRGRLASMRKTTRTSKVIRHLDQRLTRSASCHAGGRRILGIRSLPGWQAGRLARKVCRSEAGRVGTDHLALGRGPDFCFCCFFFILLFL